MTDKQFLILLGVGVGLLWYTKRQAEEAVESVGSAINPVNPDNIFNRGVNALGEAITGDEHWTLGGAIYEAVHE